MREGWSEKPLGELVEFLNNKRVPVKSLDRAKRQGPYPYYGASNVVDYIDDYIFDGTYLLISEDGENLRSRKTPIAFQAHGRFWVNNHAHILDEKEEGILDYLEAYFSKLDISPFITGAVQPKLNKKSLEMIPILLPDRNIRLPIANFLSSIKNKIDLNQQINETLEGMARAIFKDWFADFGPVKAKEAEQTPIGPNGEPMSDELVNMFPDRINTETGLPDGWNISEIEKEVSIYGGSTPSTKTSEFWEDGTYHWTTPKDLSNLSSPILLDTERKITEAGVNKITSGQLPVGTLLMSSRAPVGYLAISVVPVSINQGYIAMVCDKRISNIYAWCWAEANMEMIKGHANGSTFQEISKRNFRPLPIIVPTMDLLNAFNDNVQPLFDRMISNLRENQTLANLRDTLLPKLMSGEVSVDEIKAMGLEEKQSSNVVPLRTTSLFGEMDNTPLPAPINTLERDAVMVAAAVRVLQIGDTVVGNVRYQKAVYFMRRVNEWSLQNFVKNAAGPYDDGLRDAADEAVRRVYLRNAGTGDYQGKKPARNIGKIDSLIVKYDLTDAIDWVRTYLRGTSREEMELWATVDMAIQDLKKLRRQTTTDGVRAYIGSVNEWKAKLNKPYFSKPNIKEAINSLNKVIG